MMTKRQQQEGRDVASRLLERAGIAVSTQELDGMEIADFGLDNYPAEGAQIVTLVSTRKVGLKIICLEEGQVLPEHTHGFSLGQDGKEETFRALYGTTRLFVPGEGGACPVPVGKEAFYTSRREVALQPLQQYTVPPETPHWICGGAGGCVMYSISDWARCECDVFTDPSVVRR